MREPIILRCQCRPHCRFWIRLPNHDSGLLGDQGSVIVHPAHTRPTDRILDARPGYVVTRREKLPI